MIYIQLNRLIVLGLLVVLISKLDAQMGNSEVAADTILTHKIGWMAYPYAFYTPETELALGAGGLIHFRTGRIVGLRPSKVLMSAYYTTNTQYYFKLAPIIYLANDDETIIEANLNYGKEIAKFYGIGSETPDIDNPEYTIKSFQFYLEVQGEAFITEDIHSGPMFDFSTNDVLDISSNPYLNTGEVTGSDGGKVSGLGWGWLLDRRDNIFFPTMHGYYKFRMLYYGRTFGSDFTYNWFVLDLRQYFPVGQSGTVATQFYGEFTTGSPPFFRLPALGGPYRMRGYFYGRYRDREYLTAQVAYRQIVWWRLGVAAFAGLGEVADNFNEFALKGLKYSYGFGLRFVFDKEEKINIRMDIGFGKDTSGIYFALEEAF